MMYDAMRYALNQQLGLGGLGLTIGLGLSLGLELGLV